MNTRTHLCIAAVLALAATSRANAQTPEAAAPLLVQVDPASGVDTDALRQALEADLGLEIEMTADAGDGGPRARLHVAITPEGTVRLSFVREPGERALTRETDAPRDLRERTITIALLAANLVRNESAEVLALLRIGPEEPAPAPEPPVVIVGPPPVEPAPAPPPAVAPAEPPVAPAPHEPVLEEVPFGIDFVPAVGVSSAFLGRDRRAASLGVVVGLSGGIDGFSLSSVADLVLHDVSGFQASPVLSVAGGDLDGLQLGTVSIVGGGVEGGQAGVANIAGGSVQGTQFGVLNVAGRHVDGAQLGVVNAVGGRVAGGQFGVVNVAPQRLDGAQFGVVNVGGATVTGLQLGVVNIAGGAFDGPQLAVVNVAGGEVRGAQLGVVNIAGGRVHGLQLGLVNISEESDASIGLVNVHTRGRTQLRAGGDSTGVLNTSLVHGGRITHSILSVGVQPFQDRPAALLGLGFGARVEIDDALHLDFDALAHVVLDNRAQSDGPGLLTEARVVFGANLIDVLGVYAGISYQVHVAAPAPGGLGGPIAAHSFGTRVNAWPALVAGVELF